MRKVVVTQQGLERAYHGHRSINDGNLVITGSDADSGELVTFVGDAGILAEFAVRDWFRNDPAAELEADVPEGDVLQVVPV